MVSVVGQSAVPDYCFTGSAAERRPGLANYDQDALLALVLTSPGLTTTLELGRMPARVVYLPPQNVSQMLISRTLRHLCSAGCAISWPTDMIADDAFDAARVGGEEATLRLVYGAIENASRQPATAAQVRARVEAAIGAPCAHDTSRQLLEIVGQDGARQVADRVRSLALDEA